MSKWIKCFTFSWFSFLISSTAVDTIPANHTIRDGDTIVSAGGNFELGFTIPGSSTNRYLGIWYKKISSGTIVWIANREIPLKTTSGMLKVDSKGVLLLSDGTDNIIWSSNSSKSGKNPVAQLLDTGNFVVRDEFDQDPENFFWQSFDFPGNTILPDMKIGWDLETGLERFTSSWKSDDDPSLGDYKSGIDINGYPQSISWRGSVLNVRTGPWNGIRFSGQTSLGPNPIYTYEFVINKKEIYYKFELKDTSEFTRIFLHPEGQRQRYIWINRTQEWQVYRTLQADDCDDYAVCGAFGSCNINNSPRCRCLEGFEPRVAQDWEKADWTSGCIRKTELECGESDGFWPNPRLKLPDTRTSWYNLRMNLDECREMCLKNCSCTAYANTDIRGGGSGCLLWFEELIDIREHGQNDQDVYVRLAASEIAKLRKDTLGKKSSSSKRLVRIIVIPVLLLLTLLLGLYLLYIFKYRKHSREGTLRLGVENHGANENDGDDLPLFDFARIANATDNFSLNYKLGEGGFGPVYKGILENGQEIAVKRLSKSSRQGLDELKNEVSFIAKLQHRNLVRLLGCSTEQGERMLIYEYMPNKSLDFFIFDEEERKSLDWSTRYDIINGIARGLLYLHQDSRLRIIHRDLKASNILLDYEMNPKISDFGLARSFGGTETEANTTRVVGTYGYMSPEYATDGLFSTKSDVYSFGVLMLEIVSGMRNRGFYHPDHSLNLLGHAWRLYNEGMVCEVIDGKILETCNKAEVFRAIQIGLLCVQQYPRDRPNMSSVLLMLSSEVELPQPKQPGFYIERKSLESNSSELVGSNQYTVTLLEPR